MTELNLKNKSLKGMDYKATSKACRHGVYSKIYINFLPGLSESHVPTLLTSD